MKEEEYYTPSLSELKVGLKCEIHETSNVSKKYWGDYIITDKSLPKILDRYESTIKRGVLDWMEQSIRIKKME